MYLGNLELVYMPVINFAMQQNHVPVIKKLSAQNISNRDLENLTISFHSDPDFAIFTESRVDIVKKDELFELTSFNLKVSARYLAELTERISGNISMRITANDEQIHLENYAIDLLAYDQWNGIGMLPELLSTFVTPNHPQLPKIIKRASEILGNWTGSPSFDAYQSRNPDRVKKQMAAIYEAIAEMKIVYCTVPASFEETGQRIRMCDTIFSTQMGNCLDLSLLYAACAEAVGIHPLIIVIKGHAFAGVWLIEETFADAVNDDASLLTKRIVQGIDEILLVEATCMNAGTNTSFDEAVSSANSKIKNEEEFLLFIDVKRSRFSGIRPLPLRLRTEEGWQIVEEKTNERNNELPEELVTSAKLLDVEKIDISKQTLWERKLLDLTLRNSLLNLRVTKSTIQFIGVKLSAFEDALAKGEELQILPRPTDWDNSLRNAGVYQSINQSDPILDLVTHEFSQRRLRAYLSENELLTSVITLYRSSRLSIEENGANTLFVALGLLKWFETSLSEKARYAPLLLIPVEIVKKSAQKGFVIRTREEETMMNITLLEMLRQDFGINIGGLENLPKDDFGIDVKTVFNIIRQAIMTKKGWDVEEQSFLATFSFSKFILWNDIHYNADNLLKNKVVRSLVSGKLEWQPNLTDHSYNLDTSIHPADISLPISSDASQLQAILTSANNESFVLHGPPGTGKSQTITNIIANALYQGKRVLFVSAKKAALDVVHSRLNAVGIGAFCLELHSNKSKKSSVLDQLKKATEAVKHIPPAHYKSEAERLYNIRKELNEYVIALHAKQAFGYSLNDLFNKYSELMPAAEKVFFSPEDIAALTKEKLVVWNDIVDELKSVAGICENIPAHPLKEIQSTDYTQQIKTDSKQHLSEFIELLTGYKLLSSKITAALKIDIAVQTREQADTLERMSNLLLSMPDVPSQLFAVEHAEQNLAQIIEVANHGIKRDELRHELLQNFSKNILAVNAAPLLSEWKIAAQKWFLPRLLKQNAIVKNLKPSSLSGRVDKTGVETLLEKIIAYQLERNIIENAIDLPKTLQFLWQGGDCNWTELIKICDIVISINRQSFKLNGPADAPKWRSKLSDYFYDGSKMYIDSQRASFENLSILFKKLSETESKLKILLSIDFDKIENIRTNWIEASLIYAGKWLSNIESLKDWTSWNQIKVKARKEGLLPLIIACENGDISTPGITTEYKRGLYRSCADYIINHNSGLSLFNGKLFDEKIRKFREISRLFEKLTKEELHARMAVNIPDFTKEAAQSSEIGMLQRTIKNNGRGVSIRKLFDNIPNLLPRLTPCMLMSPISVAQYFDTNNERFDLLVFDEASQLPTCEAVGAIARAKNVIVVGDPKQMPPTSFFSTVNFDEENIDKEDMESILDDCLALSIPSQHLLWHYRSKHESLIAFSNANYYDNKLLTFPSTDDIISKVSFVLVDGYYDKGKTRQNSFEAKAIVEEVVRRLSDEELRKRSMGIVTFSVVQQFLIEDLLNEVFKSRPDLEKIANEAEEPLFIKNLENVQGDERDVILFSVGYGPDKDGKVSLNFGPVNREGGWRRLNVAVSRARYEMKVFSTLKAEHIDLNRTASQGVAGLKAFLSFAEKGKTVLAARSVNRNENNSAFVEMLAQKISQHGYHVHTNIGCSTYKIDIGVINPANNNEYLLGVLCDGNNYFNAATTRDREITQPAMLESLGWNVYRVWSADWWENPDKTIHTIIEKIKQAQEDIGKKDMEKAPVEETIEERDPRMQFEAITILDKSYDNDFKYEVCNLEVELGNTSETFLFFYNKEKIKNQINKVLEAEAPVSKNLVSKRVLNAWGISRNGARLSSYLESLFSEIKMRQVTHANNIFFWREEQHPAAYSIYRSAKNDFEKREADDLPPEEVAIAVTRILKEQISLSKEDLIRETAKLFGFAKVGSNVDNAMRQGIRVAVENGFAREENGRVSLTSKSV